MASDVLAANIVPDDARSSPPPSSDNDEVNTSSARIYFGPLHSAEQKYARRADANQPTPVRRSTRLSTLSRPPLDAASSSTDDEDRMEQDADAILAPVESEQTINGPLALEEDTPEAEPPSALASKIMRASNPSPPPSPPATPPVDEIDKEADTIPALALDEATAADPDSENSDSVSAEQASAAEVSGVEEPQEDLISFDSTATPVAPVMYVVAPTAPSTPSPHHIRTSSTVDDLLAFTPAKARSNDLTMAHSVQSGPLNYPLHVPTREATPSVEDENEVDTALSSGIFEPLSSPSPQPPSESLLDFLKPVETPASVFFPETQPLSPLRRSSRPRKSVAPYVASSPVPRSSRSPILNDLTLPIIEPLRLPHSPRVGPARRKSVKGKSKDTGMSADDSDRETTPKPDGITAQQPIVIGSSPPPEDIPTQIMLERQDKLPSIAESASNTEIEERPTRLRSLSPSSHDALMQLLSPRPATPPIEPPSTTDQDNDVQMPSTPPRHTNDESIVHADNDKTPVPQIRPSTPPIASGPFEPIRTPARRIPIADAIAQGSVSPQKDLRSVFQPKPSALSGAPVFRARALDDPTRTPAKRVPVPNIVSALPSPQKVILPQRLISPAKPSAVATEGSSKAGPGFFAKPTAARPLKPASSLPFPVIAAKPSHAPAASEKVSALPKPSTSTLRQRTARVESRIPRAGAKPYARPQAAVKTKATASESLLQGAADKKPEPSIAPVASTTTTSSVRPLRIRKVVSKPITVESDDSDVPPAAGPGPNTAAHRAAPATSSSSAASLKRKRENDHAHAQPQSMSPGVQPVMVIRKVVSTTATKRPAERKPAHAPPAPASTHAHKPTRIREPSPTLVTGARARASPAKRAPSPRAQQTRVPVAGTSAGAPAATRIQMRKVVDTKRLKARAASSSPAPQEPPSQTQPEAEKAASPTPLPVIIEAESSEVAAASAPVAHQEPAPSSEAPSPPSADTSKPIEPPSQPTETGSDHDMEVSSPIARPTTPLPPEVPDEPSPTLRRTTRARKSNPTAPISRTPAQSRRRTLVLGPPDTSVFSGMSLLALKTLTTTNTTRNQAQVAALEVEVVRKEGRRPESPTTKVRTALDRQREEKAQAREARAARRARRLQDTEEGEGTAGDVSIVSEVQEEARAPSGHMRAPGDESDYETPERPVKRGRFDEDGEKEDRRVKWNKGLQTTVFLDDTLPNPRRPKNEVIKKGCLAASAKAYALDLMGNVLNASVPVPDLIAEHIVVKKFVYEDDVEAEAAVPQELEDPPAKATRSKKKVKAS